MSATATDRAGNVTTATSPVRVAADGAIVGQVLSDATGLPLEGATVHIGAETRTTDAQGRYTLPTDQASIALSIDHAGMTSVSRTVVDGVRRWHHAGRRAPDAARRGRDRRS